MKKILYLLPIAIIPLTPTANAELSDQQRISQRFEDQRVQTNNMENHLPKNKTPLAKPTVKTAVENQSISLTKEELAQQPDLLLRAMLPAVSQGNSDNVALLFPIYQKIPAQYQDPLLTKWARAILSKKENNYRQSISLYREVLAAQADILPVRFQLAVALFENNELDAAEDQFKKLRAEPLNENAQGVISQYLNAINQRDRWTFSGGLTYLRDPNINNAPKSGTTYGNWRAPVRESAEGVGFNLNLGKKWSWGDGFFNELRLNGNGKYYWDNKKYNEITGRASLGFGFQNAKFSLALLPFMEQTLYAGGSKQSETLKRFSKAGGTALESHYWFSPKWQWNANYEYGEQRYTTRKHLNGNYHFVSIGVLYLANAKQYWFGNVSYHRNSARDDDDAYFRRAVNLGWGQEWGKGFSTRLSVSLAEKRYKGPMPIFNIQQQNKEYGVQASLWHRAVHFWGITPRLTYHYNKTKSNHDFYSYDKSRFYLDFSKQF